MDFVGLDKLSLLDYEDKVACVLFFKNCNFRCPFCHNGLTVLESDETIPFNEVMTYLKSRIGILDAVVVSGGEATLMDDLVDKITQIKGLGFLVKLDTNGTNPEVVEYLIKNNLVDYIAMDIKNSEEKYPLTTGRPSVDMEKIKKTISLLISSGISYEFRTTLVNEYHDEQSIRGLGQLIKGSKKLYLQKFVEREGCIKKGLHAVDVDLASSYKDILVNDVENVYLRGY